MQSVKYGYHKKKYQISVCHRTTASRLSNIWQRIQHFFKTIKPKCHTESKTYIDFRCEVYFDVWYTLCSCDILIFKKKYMRQSRTGEVLQFFPLQGMPLM